MNNFEYLKSVLEKEKTFCKEGKLFKNKIVESGLKCDSLLLKLLLDDKKTKEQFFTDIDGVLVFDKIKFQQFVSNKQFLPDSYTAFKNKIGLTTKGEYLTESREVVLDFPYKDCVLEGGQTKEDQKRKEIFWNETLAPDEIDRLFEPKVLTDFKRMGADGKKDLENVTFEDNLLIKGNNLLALHSLKKIYRGKVKLIYIDPPYNTGGDANIFTYNNSFNHSTWLTFMKNRLEIAKELLTEDGFIAIAIDHYELFYLGVLADEIFGRENRAGIISIIINPKGRQNPKYFSVTGEYMLVYAKNNNRGNFRTIAIDDKFLEKFDLEDNKGKYRYENFINARTRTLRINRPNHWYSIYVSPDLNEITISSKKNYVEILPISNDKQYSWKLVKESFVEGLKNNIYKAEKINNKIVILHKLREQQRINTVWTDKKYFAEFNGTNLLKKLFSDNNIFSYPKSLYTVLDTLKIMTTPNDIILDFHAGSGTTAHAVLELNKEDGGNRKFILVEQLDEHIDICRERIQKVMQKHIGEEKQKEDTLLEKNKSEKLQKVDFVSLELAKNNHRYLDEINSAKTGKDLITIWENLKKESFISYRLDIGDFDNSVKDFHSLSVENQKKFLIESLDKNHLYVNYGDMEDGDYRVSEEDRDRNWKFYER